MSIGESSLPPSSLPPSSLPPSSLPPSSLPPSPWVPAESRRRGGWVIFAVVALAAVVLGVGTGILLTRGSSGGGTGPSDAVLRFYAAVRDGNARAALTQLATRPGDTSLITDEVLRASQEQAPITDLNVPPTTSTVVQVSFRMGGEAVTDRVSVTAVGNGYKIITPVNSGGIQLGALRRPGLGLFVAAQEVKQASILLLPGTYPVRSSAQYLAYGDGRIVVKRIDDAGNVSGLGTRLTAGGLAAVKAATLASLKACVAVPSFAPPGCPFKYTGPNAATADPALSNWELVGDPTADLTVSMGADPTRAGIQTNLLVRVTVTPDGTPLVLPANGVRATVDLTQASLTVDWVG